MSAMRRKLAILLALPAVNALSLANFQSISLASIPIVCQLTYDGQIPNCVVTDFQTGCTPACVAGLNSIAKDVISACDGTHVTSNSLLGIIQSGGIQGALCPTLAKSTTTTKAKTTSAVQISTAPNDLSVTLPTDSVGVTGGLGFKTSTSTTATTTAKTTSNTKAGSTISVSIKSTSKTAQSTATADSSTPSATASSVQSSADDGGDTTPSTTSNRGSVETSSSSAQSTTKTSSNNGVSGGGSPFDISSDGDQVRSNSVLGFIIFAAWAGILLGR